ncbi:MAG TPA: GntR family transcriptional regulator [Bryobacteraceae bacterium]|nr:GntR family transcriptional regulator [Bryobacteraceae bacterium]
MPLSAAAETVRAITTKDRVASVLRTAIVQGNFQPGERIVELQLSKQLGVGITSIREALYELESEGFVTRVPNKGVYVTRLTAEDTRQIYELRWDLEAAAAQRCARHLDTDAIEQLRVPLRAMREAALAGDRARFHIHDLEFHRLLWKLSGNRFLERALDFAVAPLFAFYIGQMNPDAAHLTHSVEQHERIVDAIAAHDETGARRTVQAVLQDFQQAHERVPHEL